VHERGLAAGQSLGLADGFHGALRDYRNAKYHFGTRY